MPSLNLNPKNTHKSQQKPSHNDLLPEDANEMSPPCYLLSLLYARIKTIRRWNRRGRKTGREGERKIGREGDREVSEEQ